MSSPCIVNILRTGTVYFIYSMYLFLAPAIWKALNVCWIEHSYSAVLTMISSHFKQRKTLLLRSMSLSFFKSLIMFIWTTISVTEMGPTSFDYNVGIRHLKSGKYYHHCSKIYHFRCHIVLYVFYLGHMCLSLWLITHYLNTVVVKNNVPVWSK